ncbi:MAG: CHAT domain-containing protein [Alphaproteobacteria bacterium]
MRSKSTAIRFAMLVGLCAAFVCAAFLTNVVQAAKVDDAAKEAKAANAEQAANLSKQAELKYQQKKWSEAAQILQASTEQLIRQKRYGTTGVSGEQPSETSDERAEEHERFWRLVKVSYRAAASPVQMSETAAKMFEVAQWAQNLRSLQSFAPLAEKLVQAGSPLDELLSKRRDLLGEWPALNEKLIKLGSDKGKTEPSPEDAKLKNKKQQDKKAEDKKAEVKKAEAKKAKDKKAEDKKVARKQIVAIDDKLKEINSEIAEDYPKYASLTSLSPLPAEDVQGLLNSDEALVFFLDTPEKAPLAGETFVWVVTKSKMHWVSADIGTAKLHREVNALRCGLDANAWAKDTKCAKELGVKYSKKDYRNGRPLPFDASRSYALYKALFSKVEDQIKDKKLLIVASGALTKLPFQALVTNKPQTAFPDTEGMRKVHWFIRKYALTILPSVSSLKNPRSFAKASKAEKPYLGIGNPLLNGKNRRYKTLAKIAREKQTCGVVTAEQSKTDHTGAAAGKKMHANCHGL